MARAAYVIAIVWSSFQLYAAVFGFLPATLMRPIHVAFALALVFLVFPFKRRRDVPESEGAEEQPEDKSPGYWQQGLNVLMSLLALASIAYVVLSRDALTGRIWFVDQVTLDQMIYGLVLVGLLLEATRRAVGWSLLIVVSGFMVYLLFGPYFPGLLRHRGIELDHLVELQALSLQGIFGTPVGVVTEYVFYFVLFSAFLDLSGGGRVFIDLAVRLSARFRGGAAKSAILASAFMGSINGSAVANVVSTGIFTIPLMVRVGFSPRFAAGVEAAASSGGQILPPIMGAAAFIVAEFLGISYLNVVIAAIIPALAYFTAVFLMVDLRARQRGLAGIPADALPSLKGIVTKLHLLTPLVVLVAMLFSGRSLTLSAATGIASVVAVSLFRKETRIGLRKLLDALAQGGRIAIAVTIPCAAAGIIVGVVTYSGLGLKLSSLIVSLAGGQLLPALLLVMGGAVILGMGMPTASAYIMGAVLMAPALVELGVTPLAAHMFIFFFSAMSMVTPPVALAAFAAAGIAKTPVVATSLTAFGLALSAFLIPFAFVYQPALLMDGELTEIAMASFFLLLGVVALSASIVGFFLTRNRKVETVLFFISALLMIAPELVTDLIGVTLFAGVIIMQLLRRGRSEGARVPQRAGADV